MKNILFLLLFSSTVVAQEVENFSAQVPEQAKTIEAFVPKGWKIEKKIEGDLNKDSIADTVLALIQQKPSSADGDLQRKLLIIIKKRDKSLHKAAVAEKLLLCSLCAGMMSDGSADIQIVKGILIVKHFTGSRETQNTIQRFRYDEKTARFLLIGEDIIIHDRLTLEGTKTSRNFLTGIQIDEVFTNKKTVSKEKSKLAVKAQFIEDSVITEPTEIQSAPDFNTFWADFKTNSSDLEYVSEKSDFPINLGSIENKTIEKSDFVNIFESLIQQDLKIAAFDGKYINGYLKKSFMQKYGDLNNLYVVSSEPTPIGYMAYFKLIGNEYKFIGYEILEIAN